MTATMPVLILGSATMGYRYDDTVSDVVDIVIGATAFFALWVAVTARVISVSDQPVSNGNDLAFAAWIALPFAAVLIVLPILVVILGTRIIECLRVFLGGLGGPGPRS